MPPRGGGVTLPRAYETQALRAAPENQAMHAKVDGPRDWRCPRCGSLLSRLAVSRLAPGEWIEVKCKCNAFSTAEGGADGVVVRSGRHP